MAKPFVPLVTMTASAIAGAEGVSAAAVGAVQVRSAKKQRRQHTGRLEKRQVKHQAKLDYTAAVLQRLGRTKDKARRDVIFRMRDFLERHDKQVRVSDFVIADGVEGAPPGNGPAALTPDFQGLLLGVAGSAAAGHAIHAGLPEAVRRTGHASTGTKISTLNGAAVNKSVRAFLGGGSRKAGGGGMKLGGVVLNVATGCTTALVAGVTVKIQGSKAKTQAATHLTYVDEQIAVLERFEEVLRGLRKRAREVDATLVALMARATEALDVLESEPFDLDIDLHAERLQVARVLVAAVRDVARAPLAAEDVEAGDAGERLVFTHRRIDTEAGNGQSEDHSQQRSAQPEDTPGGGEYPSC